MRLGVRGKLFAVSVVVILAVVATSGLYLRSALRESLTERIRADLYTHAEVATELASQAENVAELRELTSRLGRVTGMRVTVVGEDGTVLADSAVPDNSLAGVPNHAGRPEIRTALEAGRGHAQRFSTTVSNDLSYVAIRYQGQTGMGVVRVAKPLEEVSEAISSVLWLLMLAGGLGLLLAIVMSGLASHLMSRTLRSLVSRARDMSNAEDKPRIIDTQDELEALSGSFNQMAEEVESTVAELAKERALVKAVLKGMSEAVVALDNELDITLMNPAAVELLGLDSENRGRSILEILRVPGLQKLLDDGPLTGPSAAEFQLPNQRHVLASMRPQRGAEGSVLVMHDVTDIRRLETVRRDFVANVSHELRTPVAIIRANAETLIEGALEDPNFSRSLIDALHRNAERLSNIITDLLDLSRIEAGRYQLDLEPVAVEGVADHAAKSIERAAAKKDISIEVDVAPETWALADSKALEQVLFNLLDNAVKYTPDGGEIRITTSADDDHYQICVEDDGPGIEARHRERIFERFYRVDPGRSRHMGGTGLGLAIVRHLVEAMGGEVSVEPAKPHGSIFVIRVPRAGERAGAESDAGAADGEGRKARESESGRVSGAEAG